MDPWIAPSAAAAVVALAALVPSPVRPGVRVALLLALLLAPVIGVGVLVAHWPGASFGTWLGLVPLAVVWLAWFDMRWGVSARFAVRRDGRTPPRANGAPGGDEPAT